MPGLMSLSTTGGITTMPPITNTDDVIDSRDVIARLEELRSLRPTSAAIVEEYHALYRLACQGQDLEDWDYGVVLVRDSYFVTYARELAEDLGALKHGDDWPYTCIDWERAAAELKLDYYPVEFAGVTYWGL